MRFSGIVISAPNFKMAMFLLLFATFVVTAQSDQAGKRHTSRYNVACVHLKQFYVKFSNNETMFLL